MSGDIPGLEVVVVVVCVCVCVCVVYGASQNCSQNSDCGVGQLGVLRKWRCWEQCFQERQLILTSRLQPEHQQLSCSALPLCCLRTCAPALAFSRQAAHSTGSLGILDMLWARQELLGVPSSCRAMEGVERGVPMGLPLGMGTGDLGFL